LDGALVPASRITLFASVWGGAMRPDGEPTELQVGGAAAASADLAGNVEAVLRYEGLVDRRGDGAGFQRHVITAGVQWRTGAPVRAKLESTAPPVAEAPVVMNGRVRFTLRAPGASSVSVVGSWNDWARGLVGQLMRFTRETGQWEVTVALPPGVHRFQFVRDGHAISPPSATRYRDDDFGGHDGIVEVETRR
jgi:hypothetical protein